MRKHPYSIYLAEMYTMLYPKLCYICNVNSFFFFFILYDILCLSVNFSYLTCIVHVHTTIPILYLFVLFLLCFACILLYHVFHKLPMYLFSCLLNFFIMF